MSLLRFFDFCTFDNSVGEGENAQLLIFPQLWNFDQSTHFLRRTFFKFCVRKIFGVQNIL